MKHASGLYSSSRILPANQALPVFFPKPERSLFSRLEPGLLRAQDALAPLALKIRKPLSRLRRPGPRRGLFSGAARPAVERLGSRLTPRRLSAALAALPACFLALLLFGQGGDGEGTPLARATPLPRPDALENVLAGDDSAVWQYSLKIVPVGFADRVPGLERESAVIVRPGEAAPGPRGALLSLKNLDGRGQPVLLTRAGALDIPKLTDIVLSGPSAPRESGKDARIATGAQPVETLLAELRYETGWTTGGGQLFAAPADPGAAWQDGGYVDDQTPSFLNGAPLTEFSPNPLDPETGSGPRCRSDRVELAVWLGRVRDNNLAMGLTQVQRASKYSAYVERYSSDYALPPSLVYAIMRIESSFNPNARSVANALGLMQVVPQTAGGEVHAFLTGQRGTPGSDLLFTPEHNIHYGTAYLYLLKNRHFKDVQNHISRELCIIAAYNGGPNAVFRTFDKDKDKAVAKINAYSPDELYHKLVRSLPSQETRDYVVKVVDARSRFRHSGLSF